MNKLEESEYAGFEEKFVKIVDEFQNDVLDAIAEEYRRRFPSKQDGANNYARNVLKKKWTTLESKL